MSTCNRGFTMAILFSANVLNYVDRFAIAGVLEYTQSEFGIGDDLTGLLQSAFILCFMTCCPISGYLGDRYSRRLLICIAVIIWCMNNLLSSFMSTFIAFMICRCGLAIGQSIYTTLAPTIIADLFSLRMRSLMLGVFYCAGPIGCGISYVLGTIVTNMTDNWRWTMRITPAIGCLFVVFLAFTRNPKRGESDGKINMKITSYKQDVYYLVQNTSYILTVGGSTCACFVIGTLAWWGFKVFHLGIAIQNDVQQLSRSELSVVFGAITIISGLFGVLLGSLLSRLLGKCIKCIDPIICGIGLILSVPLIDGALFIILDSTTWTYVFLTLGLLGLNAHFALSADIIYYVVVPTRRGSASAIQLFLNHALGDLTSPYVVGVVSETFKKHLSKAKNFHEYSLTIHFEALRNALVFANFVCILGAISFLSAACHVNADRKKAIAETEEIS